MKEIEYQQIVEPQPAATEGAELQITSVIALEAAAVCRNPTVNQ